MERTHVNRESIAAKVVRILIYCLLPLLITIGLLIISQPLINGVNSDLLYLVSLYKDLFVDHYSILGWNLTPAPYFFPDMVMFFPLLWSMPDIGYALALYSVIFFLLFLGVITKIASYLNNNSFNCFLCVFSAGLLFVALLQDSNYLGLAAIFFVPSAHAGAILSGFILIAISLNTVQKGYDKLSATAFFSLSFLTILSDIIIIPQFLLPLVITTFIFYRLHFIPRRTFRVTARLTVAAYLIASVLVTVAKLTGIFNIPTQGYINHIGNLFNTFGQLISDMSYYVNNNFRFFIIVATFIVFAVILLIKHRKYLIYNESNSPRKAASTDLVLFLIIFSFCSIIIMLAALIITDNWADRGSIRYIQTLYILPLFVLALILAVYNDRRAFWLKIIIFSTVVVFSLRLLIPGAITLEAANLKLPYPEMVQCLDRLAMNYDLQYGYSDYWNAKYTTILSRSRVRVNQVEPNLHISNWINNPAWYISKVGEDSRQYPKYQFIMTERLSKADIEARFGTPAIRQVCHGTEIYIYNRKSDVAFRNFLRIPATIANRREVPSSILSPKSLRKYVRNGTKWNARRNVIIPKNGEVSVQLDPPVVSEILEIAADSNDDYVVDFFRDETILGQLPVPRMPQPGIQARYLPLPKSILGKPFNRLVVRPLQGDGTYSVADIFFYNDNY